MTAIVARVRLPAPASLKGRPIGKRIEVLRKCALRVERRTREGMALEEARKFVAHFAPAFGSIKLLWSPEKPDGRRDLKVAVDSYLCPSCRLEFDEKDLKARSPDGVLCPKCGELVVKSTTVVARSQPAEKP